MHVALTFHEIFSLYIYICNLYLTNYNLQEMKSVKIKTSMRQYIVLNAKHKF